MLNLHLQGQRTQGLRAEKLAVDSGRGAWLASQAGVPAISRVLGEQLPKRFRSELCPINFTQGKPKM